MANRKLTTDLRILTGLPLNRIGVWLLWWRGGGGVGRKRGSETVSVSGMIEAKRLERVRQRTRVLASRILLRIRLRMWSGMRSKYLFGCWCCSCCCVET